VEPQPPRLAPSSIGAKGGAGVDARAVEAEADGLTLEPGRGRDARGDCIEDYPDDPRGPSCLVLGGSPTGAPFTPCGASTVRPSGYTDHGYLPDLSAGAMTFAGGEPAMSATLSKCFRCGSTAIESRPVEELVRRGPYVVALRLMATSAQPVARDTSSGRTCPRSKTCGGAWTEESWAGFA